MSKSSGNRRFRIPALDFKTGTLNCTGPSTINLCKSSNNYTIHYIDCQTLGKRAKPAHSDLTWATFLLKTIKQVIAIKCNGLKIRAYRNQARVSQEKWAEKSSGDMSTSHWILWCESPKPLAFVCVTLSTIVESVIPVSRLRVECIVGTPVYVEQ